MPRICEITVTFDFIFQIVHYSHEDVSLNNIFRNVFEGIKQFNLSMLFKKTRLETPFKGDIVKALVKALCITEQNRLCHFGRGHNEEHNCESILNLNHWSRRCRFKTSLYF